MADASTLDNAYGSSEGEEPNTELTQAGAETRPARLVVYSLQKPHAVVTAGTFDAESGMPRGRSSKAQCVRGLNDSHTLQFTLVIAFCYARHR